MTHKKSRDDDDFGIPNIMFWCVALTIVALALAVILTGCSTGSSLLAPPEKYLPGETYYNSGATRCPR